MIITVRDDYNKFEGTDLPMFSRSGKSTINQYLAFNHKGKAQKEAAQFDNFVEDEDAGDDIGMMMGDKPKDIAYEM